MGHPQAEPAGALVVQPSITIEQTRVIDAGTRSTDALRRATAAFARIQALHSLVLAEAVEPLDEKYPSYIAALALINHQSRLAGRNVGSATNWNRKCQNRVAKFESNGDYGSLVKAIRYAHVVEKKAALAENQAQWAEHYSIDQNREDLIDGDDDLPESGEEQQG